MIFFTSDTHFGHTNIIRYCNRPFYSIEDMNNILISNWNSVVNENDTIFHLGDFAFMSRTKAKNIISQLKGNIYILRGNHDRILKNKSSLGKATILDYKEIQNDHQSIVLFHYPIESWNKKHYGAWHLHGHCHGTLTSPGIARVDVGVDVWNYTPVSFKQIQQYMNKI